MRREESGNFEVCPRTPGILNTTAQPLQNLSVESVDDTPATYCWSLE